MDRNFSRFTVLFQPPFWVGIGERWEADGYSVARVVFGAEPTDAQLLQWLDKEWHRLRFSPAAEGERPFKEHGNPKRALREARAATQVQRISTRAQEALSRQREQDGLSRKAQNRHKRQEEAEQKYLLRRQKKREKKRGR